jgi:hypothetical protein
MSNGVSKGVDDAPRMNWIIKGNKYAETKELRKQISSDPAKARGFDHSHPTGSTHPRRYAIC